jgi:hypothetical protein
MNPLAETLRQEHKTARRLALLGVVDGMIREMYHAPGPCDIGIDVYTKLRAHG